MPSPALGGQHLGPPSVVGWGKFGYFCFAEERECPALRSVKSWLECASVGARAAAPQWLYSLQCSCTWCAHLRPCSHCCWWGLGLTGVSRDALGAWYPVSALTFARATAPRMNWIAAWPLRWMPCLAVHVCARRVLPLGGEGRAANPQLATGGGRGSLWAAA